jgi:uncharacterized protein
MRKNFKILIAIIIVILIGIAGAIALPKYAGRMPLLLVLLALDFYYWKVMRQYLWPEKRPLHNLVSVLYWLPFFLLLLFVMGSGIWSIRFWPPVLGAFLPGLAVVGFIAKIVLYFFLILADAVALIRFVARKVIWKANAVKFVRWRPIIVAGVSFSGLILGLLIIGMVYWVYDFNVKTITIESGELSAEFDGVRLVQVSDIHLGSWISDRPLKRAVGMINGLKPDIVLFTGDLVNFSTDEAYPFEKTLLEIKAPMGIYAITGNHDYGDYVQWPSKSAKKANDDSLVACFQHLGWKYLDNHNVILRKGNNSIAIAGVENWSKMALWGRRGKLKEALAGTDSIPFIILLSHDPSHWEAEVSTSYPQVDLTLSGHTHGMQLGLETKYFSWSPSQYIFTYWAGLYRKINKSGGEQFLYVNRGLGHLGYPGRVGIRPEITLIILKRK